MDPAIVNTNGLYPLPDSLTHYFTSTEEKDTPKILTENDILCPRKYFVENKHACYPN